MRIYLDNCCFNRPFDDQSQVRVRVETEAKLCIQEQVRSGAMELVWSYILSFENLANPFAERRVAVSGWQRFAVIDVVESAEILNIALSLAGKGLKANDALHVACAISAGCSYYVTTDDRVLKRQSNIGEISLVDPTAFVRELKL